MTELMDPPRLDPGSRLELDGGLDRDTALRIALAARSLPGVEGRELLAALIDQLGLPLNAARLSSLDRRSWAEICDDFELVPGSPAIAEGLRLLQAGKPELEPAPEPTEFRPSEWDRSVRVGCASNRGEWVDGHFGSCLRFLIYQVSADRISLIDVRGNPVRATGTGRHSIATAGMEATERRVTRIEDCNILYIQSIGGPAAGRVVNAGIHPVKLPAPILANEPLVRLQQALRGNPAPWLAAAAQRPPEPLLAAG